MSAASVREPRTQLIVIGALVTSVVVGVCAGIKPMLGIEVAGGIGFALLTVANLTYGLVLFTILSFLEVINTTSGASYTKLAGLLLFGSWFAARASQRPELRSRLRSMTPGGLVAGTLALIAWAAASAAWAADSGVALSNTERFLLEVILIPIVLTAIRRREQLQWFLAAFVLGAVVSAVDGFLHSAAAGPGGYGRLTGGVGDPNEQAAVLVAAIPMAMALAGTLRGHPALRRWAWLSALICLVGALETLSRGGLVALGVTLVAAVIFGGRWRRGAALMLVAVALGSVGYYLVVAGPAAQQRVTMSDSSGRTDIWAVAWRMIQAHPLDGVGAGNFQNTAVNYVQAPGTLNNLNLIVDVPHVAHNIYLEMLADLGVPGLLFFLAIVLSAVGAALSAARRFERAGDREMELVARALLLVLVAFMTADFFLSGQYSKQLWLAIALCPAVLNLTADPAGATLRRARVPGTRRSAQRVAAAH